MRGLQATGGICDDGRLRMSCPLSECNHRVAVESTRDGYTTPAMLARWHERMARHIRVQHVQTPIR